MNVENQHDSGIEPDVYIRQTIEYYRLKEKYRMNGGWDYEESLKYDTVLKWIIQ